LGNAGRNDSAHYSIIGRAYPETDSLPFGYKLHTGGVKAEAFTSAQIAKALVLPAEHQVPIKFTAGLHHPLRQWRDEVQTKMHGFLNVLRDRRAYWMMNAPIRLHSTTPVSASANGKLASIGWRPKEIRHLVRQLQFR